MFGAGAPAGVCRPPDPTANIPGSHDPPPPLCGGRCGEGNVEPPRRPPESPKASQMPLGSLWGPILE